VTGGFEIVGSFRHRKRNTPGATTITIQHEIIIQNPTTSDFEIQFRNDGGTNSQWGSGEGTGGDQVPGGSTQNSGTLTIERLNE